MILDNLKKNCVLSSGRFGVVGPETAMEGLVSGQGVPNQRKIVLPRTVPFFPGGLQHLAQQFKQLENGGYISLRNDGVFNHYTVQKPKMEDIFPSETTEYLTTTRYRNPKWSRNSEYFIM